MKMKWIFSCALSLIVGLTAQHAQAWSSPGHMIIASFAYRDLSDADRKTVDELLTHHPDYAAWKSDRQSKAPNLDQGTYIFMRASTWPDDIKYSGNPYDHPNWHFIDYPLKPRRFAVKPDASPTDNILCGITQCEDMLQNTGTSDTLRAVYLSWLIHLIGDLHQPLHCATLVTAVYPPPIGDRGGNHFYVKPAKAGIPLHTVWDHSLGSSVHFQTQFNYATQLRSDNTRASLSELTQATTSKAWSLESRSDALNSGYLRGKLKGGTTKTTAIELPADYTKNLKTLAEHRAALAGYRLADKIAANVK